MARSSESRRLQILVALKKNLEVAGGKKMGQIPWGVGIRYMDSQEPKELAIVVYKEAHIFLKEGTEKSTTGVEVIGHQEKDISLELVLGRGQEKEFELLNEKQTIDEPGRLKAAILAKRLQGAMVVGDEGKRKIWVGE